MSTFNDRVKSVVKVTVNEFSDSGGFQNAYTCPAGVRAYVFIQRLLQQSGTGASETRWTFSNGSILWDAEFTWSPVTGFTSTPGLGGTPNDTVALGIPLYPGDTIDWRIQLGSGGQDYELDAVVLEFAL